MKPKRTTLAQEAETLLAANPSLDPNLAKAQAKRNRRAAMLKAKHERIKAAGLTQTQDAELAHAYYMELEFSVQQSYDPLLRRAHKRPHPLGDQGAG